MFDEIFATKDLAEWRKILDGNGLVFGVVGILDDIPNDRQMIENEVLVPFEDDTMLTVNSPIWVDGSQEGPADASRPASASTATRSCATPAMTRPRSGSCGRRARWPDGALIMPTLPAALFPGVGEQLQAGADADPVRPDASSRSGPISAAA